MAINKITRKLDDRPLEVINLEFDMPVNLDIGNHTEILRAYDEGALIDTKTRNFNVEKVVSYDPKTEAYMNAVGTPNDATPSIYPNKTNADIWNLCEQVVQYINTNNGWGGTKTIHLMQGDTATKNSHNLKDINTFPMTFFGGWIHDANGNKGNGTNTYGQFGFTPITELTTENSAFVISSLSETSITTPIFLGCGAGTGNKIIITKKFNDAYYTMIGDNRYLGASNSAIGVLTTKRKDGIMTTKSNNTIIDEQPQSGSLPVVELGYGAYNTDSSTDNYLGSFAICTADVEPIITQALMMWEEGLGRKAI